MLKAVLLQTLFRTVNTIDPSAPSFDEVFGIENTFPEAPPSYESIYPALGELQVEEEVNVAKKPCDTEDIWWTPDPNKNQPGDSKSQQNIVKSNKKAVQNQKINMKMRRSRKVFESDSSSEETRNRVAIFKQLGNPKANRDTINETKKIGKAFFENTPANGFPLLFDVYDKCLQKVVPIVRKLLDRSKKNIQSALTSFLSNNARSFESPRSQKELYRVFTRASKAIAAILEAHSKAVDSKGSSKGEKANEKLYSAIQAMKDAGMLNEIENFPFSEVCSVFVANFNTLHSPGMLAPVLGSGLDECVKDACRSLLKVCLILDTLGTNWNTLTQSNTMASIRRLDFLKKELITILGEFNMAAALSIKKVNPLFASIESNKELLFRLFSTQRLINTITRLVFTLLIDSKSWHSETFLASDLSWIVSNLILYSIKPDSDLDNLAGVIESELKHGRLDRIKNALYEYSNLVKNKIYMLITSTPSLMKSFEPYTNLEPILDGIVEEDAYCIRKIDQAIKKAAEMDDKAKHEEYIRKTYPELYTRDFQTLDLLIEISLIITGTNLSFCKNAVRENDLSSAKKVISNAFSNLDLSEFDRLRSQENIYTAFSELGKLFDSNFTYFVPGHDSLSTLFDFAAANMSLYHKQSEIMMDKFKSKQWKMFEDVLIKIALGLSGLCVALIGMKNICKCMRRRNMRRGIPVYSSRIQSSISK